MGQDETDADQRKRNADKREAALDAREPHPSPGDRQADGKVEAQAILANADERDVQAEARDSRADDAIRQPAFSPSSTMRTSLRGSRLVRPPAWTALTPETTESQPPMTAASSPETRTESDVKDSTDARD
jgi:hypothetical protein